MDVRIIFAILAVVFLSVGLIRMARDGFRMVPASRTWLLIAAIFALVGVWLSIR